MERASTRGEISITKLMEGSGVSIFGVGSGGGMQLVLSLFPGIGLLDRAFEEEGYCVVRGPDVIWGGDIQDFHPPAGKFDGVIGGPPCQAFSSLAHLVRHNGHEPSFGNLIPEFERCVYEAHPVWFVMENVPNAPFPRVLGYDHWNTLLTDSDVGGVQPRQRRISFGMRLGEWTNPLWSPLNHIEYRESSGSGHSIVGDARSVPVKIGGSGKLKRSVTGDARQQSTGARVRRKDGGGGELPHMGATLSVEDMLEAQGLPRDYLDHAPFTVQGKRKAVGNGVPLPMGRAIARAVRKAVGE